MVTYWCESCQTRHALGGEDLFSGSLNLAPDSFNISNKIGPIGEVTVSWIPKAFTKKKITGIWVAHPECVTVHDPYLAYEPKPNGWRDRGPGYDHEHYEIHEEDDIRATLAAANEIKIEMGKINAGGEDLYDLKSPAGIEDFRRRWLNALTGATPADREADALADMEDLDDEEITHAPMVGVPEDDEPGPAKPYHAKIFVLDGDQKELVSLDLTGVPEIVSRVITWVGDVVSDYTGDKNTP